MYTFCYILFHSMITFCRGIVNDCDCFRKKWLQQTDRQVQHLHQDLPQRHQRGGQKQKLKMVPASITEWKNPISQETSPYLSLPLSQTLPHVESTASTHATPFRQL